MGAWCWGRSSVEGTTIVESISCWPLSGEAIVMVMGAGRGLSLGGCSLWRLPFRRCEGGLPAGRGGLLGSVHEVGVLVGSDR